MFHSALKNIFRSTCDSASGTRTGPMTSGWGQGGGVFSTKRWKERRNHKRQHSLSFCVFFQSFRIIFGNWYPFFVIKSCVFSVEQLELLVTCSSARRRHFPLPLPASIHVHFRWDCRQMTHKHLMTFAPSTWFSQVKVEEVPCLQITAYSALKTLGNNWRAQTEDRNWGHWFASKDFHLLTIENAFGMSEDADFLEMCCLWKFKNCAFKDSHSLTFQPNQAKFWDFLTSSHIHVELCSSFSSSTTSAGSTLLFSTGSTLLFSAVFSREDARDVDLRNDCDLTRKLGSKEWDEIRLWNLKA